MATSLTFRVDPGIELRAALRGPRLSLGPRILRLERDGGGVDEHTAAQWGVWARLSDGGLLPEPSPRTRRERRRKEQEWQTVHDHLVAVTTMHERPLARAHPPVLHEPEIDRDEVRRELMTEATDGLSPLAVVARGRVRRATRPYLEPAVDERVAELRAAFEGEREAVQSWWQALLRNDPDVVRERLHLAFAQHRFAGAVAAVEGDRVDLVVPVAKASALVGDREPTTEAGGARTLPRMTKERRHEWYEAAIGSGLMCTAAEVFAVAPGVGRVAIAVVAPEHVGGPAVLMLVEVTRQLVLPDGAEHAAIGAVADVERVEDVGMGGVVIDRGDVSGALRPLEESHPDVAAVLEVLTTELTS